MVAYVSLLLGGSIVGLAILELKYNLNFSTQDFVSLASAYLLALLVLQGTLTFFTEPRLHVIEDEPRPPHFVKLKHSQRDFSIFVVKIGVYNEAGKLSKTAKECRAGISLSDAPTTVEGILAWQRYSQDEIELPGSVNVLSAKSIVEALRPTVFAQTETVLHRRDGQSVIVAFGLETTGKIYLATDPPIPTDNIPSNRAFYHVVISADECASIRSNSFSLVGSSWKNFQISFVAK